MNSMTGFGRSEAQIGAGIFTIEAKSVNHRYLDARFRLPAFLNMYEIPLTEILRAEFDRGSFEITVKHRFAAQGTTAIGGTKYVVDEIAAKSLIEGCEWLHKNYKIEKLPTLEMLAMTNRVFLAQDESLDASAIWEDFKNLYKKTLTDLKKMRGVEGERLKGIFLSGLDDLEKIAKTLSQLSADHPKKVEQKLRNRIAQWQISGLDAQRLEWEVAFYAERSDITEEIDRLQTHSKEFRALVVGKKAVGRKLDFMTQELHREVNTIASKADDIDVTKLAVEGKTIIEKLREQVQNVE